MELKRENIGILDWYIPTIYFCLKLKRHFEEQISKKTTKIITMQETENALFLGFSKRFDWTFVHLNI